MANTCQSMLFFSVEWDKEKKQSKRKSHGLEIHAIKKERTIRFSFFPPSMNHTMPFQHPTRS